MAYGTVGSGLTVDDIAIGQTVYIRARGVHGREAGTVAAKRGSATDGPFDQLVRVEIPSTEKPGKVWRSWVEAREVWLTAE